MKRLTINKNVIIVFLIALGGVLSFCGFNVSNAVLVEDKIVTEYVEVEDVAKEEDVFSFLGMAYNEELLKQEEIEEQIEEEAKEKKISAEDPSKLVKKQEAIKGVAKEVDVKTEVQRYETNETSFGIDVSTWQGKIDWKKVKAANVNFAMIRVGFRGIDSGEITMDNRFLENIKGAVANNINVGVYFFSMAKNEAEAIEEAQWMIDKIKDYDISYPVAIDIEIFNQGRLEGVSNAQMTDNAIAFCNYVRGKGYTPMIYSYSNALTKVFETARFGNERIWLAQYNDNVTYKGTYHMWQYTSAGTVNGINGRVDMNVAYFSVTNDVTKREVVNGVSIPDDRELVDFYVYKIKTKLNKDVTLRTSPYLNYPNKAGILEKDTEITITGFHDEWTRIEYQGNTFFINDLTSYELELPKVKFKKVDIDATTKREVLLLKEPYLFIKENRLDKIPEETEIKVTGIGDFYTRLVIDEEVYYVEDKDFYDIVKENEVVDDEEDPDVLGENTGGDSSDNPQDGNDPNNEGDEQVNSAVEEEEKPPVEESNEEGQ